MGCIASICAAAACSCCVGISCKCCGLMVTVSKSIATRVWYAGTFIIISLLAWILRTWGQDMFGWVGDCKDDSYDCGTLLAYKITFPLFLYHILLSLVLIGVKNTRDSRAQIQNGWWAIKIPALILMTVGSFFIPADFYDFYAWTCVIGAGIFILIQLVLLIDFAYDWSESWAGKYEENPEENKSYWWLLLCAALVLFLGVLGLDATMYGLFCFDNWYNPVVITLCLCACLAVTVLSILPKVQEFNPRLGLIQAGVVSLYCTYLIWSAILSEPLQVDLTSTLGQVIYWMSVVGGALFTVISVVYSSLRMGSTNSFATETLEVEEAKPRVVDEDDDLKKGTDEVPLLDDELPTDDELNGTSYNYSLFHIAFALGSMFVVMLLTNWSIVSGDNANIGTDMGWTSFGIKLGACVLGFLLYLWTIFAPAIFPNRVFH